ncbi:MAG TPA: carbonic anhydrase family protein [Lamprocystis sp. (in: g-proteobacteria)]|nr:carbonic anhydrase family protein [Lamprocystis sp. (in: g-proteobacteria)]
MAARDPSVSSPGAWSYAGVTGPDHWADLSAAFAACRDGQQQSPIDIRSVQPIPHEPLQFSYRTQTLDAVNDGRGVQVRSPRGSTLRVRGEDFGLTAFHFHTPGETLINGAAAAAEVHLVHRSTDGRDAVVVVPIQAGPHINHTLARIVERLPLQPGERVRYREVGVNPLLLLPPDQGYYAYTGSLGNPPCSEPVDWYILAQPVELAPEQLRRLARATGTNNVRPVQPLKGRSVFASFPR